MKTLGYVVYHAQEFQLDGHGFWHNEEGWTTLETADVYETPVSPIPLGAVVMPYEQAKSLVPAGLPA